MKKKLPKLTLGKETLRNLSETQSKLAAGDGWTNHTCGSCQFSCDPYTFRICVTNYNC